MLSYQRNQVCNRNLSTTVHIRCNREFIGKVLTVQRDNSISIDYKTNWADYKKPRVHGLHWALLGTVSGLLLGLFSLTSFDANAIRIKELSAAIPITEQPVSLEIPSPQSALDDVATRADEPAIVAAISQLDADKPGDLHEVIVQSGDSLARIFSKHNIPSRQLHDILEADETAKKLTRIYPGQKLLLRTSEEKGLLELRYEIDALSQLHVTRTETGFETSLIDRPPERRSVSAAGTINSSLFLAANRAGLPEKITMELAGIFGWDVDFALDIREGDQFAVLYEQLYLDGERIGTGNILAAEFTNQGKIHRAVRYTDPQGHTDYYAPDGHSMRKTFLRTPVAFSRISSRFNLARKHPILNRIRAHKGVDYAASRGTPITATGNGKIDWLGKKGGYGNTIVIQHGSKYSTLYAHLNSYGRGLKKGSRVRQGQIIGYVGSSGLASGPHLHYEFRVDGVHRNPLTVKLPNAAPLPAKYRDQFKLASSNLLAQLETAKTTATVAALQSE